MNKPDWKMLAEELEQCGTQTPTEIAKDFAVGFTVYAEPPPAPPAPPAPIIYNAGGRVTADVAGKKVYNKAARRLIRAQAKREAKDARSLELQLRRKESK